LADPNHGAIFFSSLPGGGILEAQGVAGGFGGGMRGVLLSTKLMGKETQNKNHRR